MRLGKCLFWHAKQKVYPSKCYDKNAKSIGMFSLVKEWMKVQGNHLVLEVSCRITTRLSINLFVTYLQSHWVVVQSLLKLQHAFLMKDCCFVVLFEWNGHLYRPKCSPISARIWRTTKKHSDLISWTYT